MNYFHYKCMQGKPTDYRKSFKKKQNNRFYQLHCLKSDFFVYWRIQNALYFEMGTLTPEIMTLVLPVFRGKLTPEQALSNVDQLEKVKSVQ